MDDWLAVGFLSINVYTMSLNRRPEIIEEGVIFRVSIKIPISPKLKFQLAPKIQAKDLYSRAYAGN